MSVCNHEECISANLNVAPVRPVVANVFERGMTVSYVLRGSNVNVWCLGSITSVGILTSFATAYDGILYDSKRRFTGTDDRGYRLRWFGKIYSK